MPRNPLIVLMNWCQSPDPLRMLHTLHSSCVLSCVCSPPQANAMRWSSSGALSSVVPINDCGVSHPHAQHFQLSRSNTTMRSTRSVLAPCFPALRLALYRLLTSRSADARQSSLQNDCEPYLSVSDPRNGLCCTPHQGHSSTLCTLYGVHER